jgi:hypothetical protein
MTQNAPKDEKWLLRRLDALEKRLKTLETAPRSGNASVSYGKFVVQDGETGNQLFRIGYLGTNDDGDVRGVEIFRPSGELAFSTWTGADGDTGNFWAFYDKSGNTVVSDDIASGQGLATPLLGSPVFAPGDTSKWPSAVTGSYVTQFAAQLYKQQPRLRVEVWTISVSGTSGDIRVSCNGVSASEAVGSNDNTNRSLTLTPPGANLDNLQITIDMRRTAGTGFIGCYPLAVYGLGS